MLQMCQCHNSTISSFFSQIDHKQRPRACTSARTQTQKAHICAADEQVCDHECIFPLSFSLCRPTCLKNHGWKRMWTGAKQGHNARFLGKLSASETQMRKVGGPLLSPEHNTL